MSNAIGPPTGPANALEIDSGADPKTVVLSAPRLFANVKLKAFTAAEVVERSMRMEESVVLNAWPTLASGRKSIPLIRIGHPPNADEAYTCWYRRDVNELAEMLKG